MGRVIAMFARMAHHSQRLEKMPIRKTERVSERQLKALKYSTNIRVRKVSPWASTQGPVGDLEGPEEDPQGDQARPCPRPPQKAQDRPGEDALYRGPGGATHYRVL